jgi:hypothetical protein
MPKVENHERTQIRYEGLVHELGVRGADYFFAEQHLSYDASTHSFSEPRDIARNLRTDLSGEASIVRDLTMTLHDQPLFSDVDGPTVVHHPNLNRFIANKDNLVESAPEIHPLTLVVDRNEINEAIASLPGSKVVVKPTIGHLSRDVVVGHKAEVATSEFAEGRYLVQEFIDTSSGMPEHGIEGVHNLRILSVDNHPIGAVARVGGRSGEMLSGDFYGNVLEFDHLNMDVQRIVGTVHDILNRLPGDGRNVIAIDTMRGVNSSGDMVDVLCEVNRRPQRISRYDLRDQRNLDMKGIEWLGSQWDKHEAEMLTKLP